MSGTPTIALDDLITPVTETEAEQSLYQVMADPLGMDVTAWKDGSVVRSMIAAVAVDIGALSSLQAAVARMGFLSKASGDGLTVLAHEVYNEDRVAATFATGFVTLTNSAGGVYGPFSAGDLIFSTAAGQTYRNAASIATIAALTTYPNIPVTADVAGSVAGFAAPGDINNLVTSLSGVSVTNPNTLFASDDQSDAQLRQVCSLKLGSFSPNGPWDAYAYAARKSVRADGTSIGVTRTRLLKDGLGNVYFFAATDSPTDPEVPGTVGDLSTDLGLVDQDIQMKAAPQAVTAHTMSATNVVVDVTYEVWMYNTSGSTEQQIKDQIANVSLPQYFTARPIGGDVITSPPGLIYVDAIKAAIASAFPGLIFHVIVTAPASDVSLTVSTSVAQVAALGTVTCTAVHQEPPPTGFGG